MSSRSLELEPIRRPAGASSRARMYLDSRTRRLRVRYPDDTDEAVGGGATAPATQLDADGTTLDVNGIPTSSVLVRAGGAAVTGVQATTDETMLVRRGGVLQWVPLVAMFAYTADLIEPVDAPTSAYVTA